MIYKDTKCYKKIPRDRTCELLKNNSKTPIYPLFLKGIQGFYLFYV